jgi:hypothetical protein
MCYRPGVDNHKTNPPDPKTARAPFFEPVIEGLAVKRAVITFPNVQDLVRRINEGFADADEAGRKLVTIARNTGNLLHQWKAEVGHGNWTRAYEESGFKKSLDTEQTWMELSALTDAEIANISSIRQALAKLKEKKPKKEKAKPKELPPPPDPNFTPQNIYGPPPVTETIKVEPEPSPPALAESAPSALPDHNDEKHRPLWKLDELLGRAQDIMRKADITKFGRFEGDETQTLITLLPPEETE